MCRILSFLFAFFFYFHVEAAPHPRVKVGIDLLLTPEYESLLKGKRVGLITNHTAINGQMKSTIDLLKEYSEKKGFTLQALFAPEHGLTGANHASENVVDGKDGDSIPIYSLHGSTQRPTPAMLKNLDLLIYDIQDIGSRSYTYSSTLFFAMEEAAKHQVPVVVLDRPNPINGIVVDGPLLEEKWRSIVGYISVPYCHGMTIGELAMFFNSEYKVGCDLTVIPMKGWNRKMTFQDTGLVWIPTSPQVPEASTAFYYPTTGILGELQIVNIGVGYTLPFKLVGAPWINGEQFAAHLNAQKFPGVHFRPFYYKPFYGRFAHENCQGVLIVITNPLTYKPVTTQYLLIGILKSLYPAKFYQAISAANHRKAMFCKINGTEEVYRIIKEDKYITWKLKELHQKEREEFHTLRKKYLISSYGQF